MQKIKDGALFAIGFMVVAIALGYAYSYIAMKFFDASDYGIGVPTDSIKIVESRLEKRENRIVVLGKYRNDGDSSLNNLTIQADFFAADGTFLDQCEDYSSGALAAGQEAYFKLECSSCADLTLDDIDSHKVIVTSAY